MSRLRPTLLIALLLALPYAATATENSSAAWNALVDDFFTQIFFKFSPSGATSVGIHDYDSQLEDFSKAAREQEIAAVTQFEKRVAAFPANSLSETDAADREMLLGTLRSSLLSDQVIRPWQKDPNSYPAAATNSVYVIMNRRFAPPDDRLRSVIARELKIPAIFVAARANLQNPPRISTEIAIEQLPGIIGFFETDLPSGFKDASDRVKADFAKSNATVIAELKKYQSWLKDDLLPRSKGDFRIGAATFSKKLLYDEMVDTSLDRLLEIGTADLHKNQAEFARIAKLVDPEKSPTDVLAMLAIRHPAPGELLQTFTNTFGGLIAFIQSHQIITIPSDIRPTLQETPPFERATTTASMDTPGPFETHAAEAYFNVTLPGPNDSPEEIAGLMAGFNVGTIISTAVHETYPGHYVQFLWAPRAPTKLRKILGANTNAEGWAHYCEQMMLDEGYAQPGVGAKDETESRLIRLGQLQDALLRDARFVVGIQMHRGVMTFDQAKEFFVKEGYQSPKIAEIETKRGTTDPTYLYYTLGKLEILKLREDYRKKLGSDFSLLKFHDAFMSQGFPPIQIVRKALLGDSSPVL
ncbi:MAG TPA: DUF885 domain-containing protein [Candidatus Dormibacteraeota bacterium]|jgi:hypothetical protein|nr:DUF885 domain-containing protein [Candidatus Dormibacteraeota bacterium]